MREVGVTVETGLYSESGADYHLSLFRSYLVFFRPSNPILRCVLKHPHNVFHEDVTTFRLEKGGQREKDAKRAKGEDTKEMFSIELPRA